MQTCSVMPASRTQGRDAALIIPGIGFSPIHGENEGKRPCAALGPEVNACAGTPTKRASAYSLVRPAGDNKRVCGLVRRIGSAHSFKPARR